MLVAEQLKIFFLIFSWGLFLAFLSDCYSVLRRIVKPGKLTAALGDVVFWLVAAVISFLFFLHVNLAEIRFYVFLALACGWGLYILLLGQRVKVALWKIWRFNHRIFSRIFTPLVVLLGLAASLFAYPFRIFKLFAKKSRTFFKTRAKSVSQRIVRKRHNNKPPQ